MTPSLAVARVAGSHLVHVGTISRLERGMPEAFSYADSYIEHGGMGPLSLSLPLTRKAFQAHELRPFFEGLLPEGPTRKALVGQLGLPADDYLPLLGAIGLDCIGNVVILPYEHFEGASVIPWDAGSYETLDDAGMRATLTDLSSLALSNGQSRLSLAGTQGKVGLAHPCGTSLQGGWLRPLGGATSTHILKTSNQPRIADVEVVCMQAARARGLHVARIDVLSFGQPVACVKRFDRSTTRSDGTLRVKRPHQEDLAQAFGIASPLKYLELEGGTYRAIAGLLEDQSLDPLSDIDALARIAVLDYLTGNCDNHLKNLAVMHEGEHVRLAPAYDIVCTTFFGRFSREMGKRLGFTRNIDYVEPSDLSLLAKDLDMGVRRLRHTCSNLVESFNEAIVDAGEDGGTLIETLPDTARHVIKDAATRLAVVDAFAHGA